MNQSSHGSQGSAALPQSPLGQTSAYTEHYDPGLLFPIARQPKRDEIGVGAQPIFIGADLWTAYELSWLNPKGKPQVAIAHITVPAHSSHIVESKSFKLYLNSYNQTPFASHESVVERLRGDLSAAVWHGQTVQASVGVRLLLPEQFDAEPVHELDGLSLDRLDIECSQYQPAPELLRVNPQESAVTETLVSHLLKSNCLVTGQPDWGSVQITYSGHPIDQESLLQYIVSFRQHTEFHEQCVERIFMDIWQRCKPTQLTVYARYTRRGGLDISPWRSSKPAAVPRHVRTARQ
jgi:7-cyano-7-deazaguanine reductase